MTTGWRVGWLVLTVGVVLTGQAASNATSGVRVVVDMSSTRPISRFIYGLNFAESRAIWGQDAPVGITLNRMGGNRLSAYNWETNASNCGNDCNGTYPNDGYLVGGGNAPGQAVVGRRQWSLGRQAAFLATVPMLGFVAGDQAGPVQLSVPLASRRASRFVVSQARKGRPFDVSPSLSDGVVYQDEFVHRLQEVGAPGGETSASPLWFSLDNEPDLWGSTHEEVRGNRAGTAGYVLTGYDELVRRSVDHAAAIKDVAPYTLVFGPAVSNWNGMANLFHNDTPDPAGRQFFLTYYLDRMRQEEARTGRRLLDVLDVHWYAESLDARSQPIGNEWGAQDAAAVHARAQAPRSLWDPTYVETSWVAQAAGGAVKLIPRLREMVDKHYPGTRIAITEYFFHRGGDISGALAQADALGVFGREGVFAAALWPQGSQWAYDGDLPRTYACVFAAFRAFRDYDGKGSAFGAMSFSTVNTEEPRVAVYASGDGAPGAGRVVLVAINKSNEALDADLVFRGEELAGTVEAWRVSGSVGRCAGPYRIADAIARGGVVSMSLPPLSITTLSLQR
jgi:hypothetical protein